MNHQFSHRMSVELNQMTGQQATVDFGATLLKDSTIPLPDQPIEDKNYGDHDSREVRLQPTDEDIVVMSNLHKTYLLGVEGVPALRGVSVSIKRGEFVIILGKSGGGKTTMLNIIGTIDKPTKGDLIVCGKKITNRTTDAEFAMLRLRKIGFVFQTFNLISSMTAQENVELPMILDGRRTRAERRKRAADLLTRVGIGARLDHLPSQLSGGEQQRTTIARAISNNPELLLLDEPTGDLDTKNSHIILRMLIDLNRKHGMTMVMVTHDQSLKQYAHRVINMVDGKIFKIENISEEARLEAERNLDLAIEQDRQRHATVVPAGEETEIRDPDVRYPYHSGVAAHYAKMASTRE